MPITYTSGEQVEVYRFNWFVTFFVPALALLLQAFIPLRLHFFTIFDLPLLVTIFFAMARRSPIAGLLTGAVIGIAQDALTHRPIGLYGISKTVVGFLASSLGIKLDVENAGTRFLVTLIFYVIHLAIYAWVARYLVSLPTGFSWQHELVSGLANAVLGVVIYALLDRLKQRA